MGVFLEHGFEGASMDAIARAAGVSKPVVYDCFANKGELFKALFQREEARVMGEIAAALPAASPAGRETALIDGLAAFLRAVAASPQAYRTILLGEGGMNAAVARRIRAGRQQQIDAAAAVRAAADRHRRGRCPHAARGRQLDSGDPGAGAGACRDRGPAVTTILPSTEEIQDLVPQPGSAVWRYSGDVRLLATAAYAILLQVAHPTVGAGVSEHSDFRADPWGRLWRTLDYSYAMVYGGPELAGEIGARIRRFHSHIKGVKPDGERYSALEPEAYAWVHATLADSIVRGHALLGSRMTAGEIEEFYADWRRNGRLIGVRERDLPEGWDAFREYFDRTVAERLEDTPAVHEVLEALADPARPDGPAAAVAAWRVGRVPIAHSTLLVTGGLLPPRLRGLFGIRWTAGRQLELNALAAASRATTPLLPESLRVGGPRYLHWRHEAIARGEVAGDARIPKAA
jgi:uncharacterized protein (DUF2236 family)